MHVDAHATVCQYHTSDINLKPALLLRRTENEKIKHERKRKATIPVGGYKAVCALHSPLAAGFLKSRLTGIHMQTAEHLCERECSTINTQQARRSLFLSTVTSVSAKRCLAPLSVSLHSIHSLSLSLPFYPSLIHSFIPLGFSYYWVVGSS